MSRLRQDFYRNLAGESSHPLNQFHITAESDGEAIALAQEAGQDAAEANEEMEVANQAIATAEKAEDAGTVFNAAANVVEAGGEVPEAPIAQADALAADVAETVGADVAEMLPSVSEEDRTVISGESANGTYRFKPGYTSLRRDARALRLAGESMFQSAASLGKSAWDAILRAWDKACQFFLKHIGTYPRAKARLEKMKEVASNMSGKKLETAKFDISGSTALNLTTPSTGGSATPIYLNDAAKVSGQADKYRALIEGAINYFRSNREQLNDIASDISGGSFTNTTDTDSLFQKIKDFLTPTYGSLNTKIVNDRKDYTTKDVNITEIYEKELLTGYKRLVNISFIAYVISHRGTLGVPISKQVKYENDISDLNQAKGHYIKDGDIKGKTNVKKDFSFTPMSAAQVEEVCNSLINTLEELISYRNSKEFLKVKETLRKLQAAKSKIEANVARDSGRQDDETTSVAKANRDKAKAVLELARYIVRENNLFQDIMNLFDRFLSAAENVCSISLSKHKTND